MSPIRTWLLPLQSCWNSGSHYLSIYTHFIIFILFPFYLLEGCTYDVLVCREQVGLSITTFFMMKTDLMLTPCRCSPTAFVIRNFSVSGISSFVHYISAILVALFFFSFNSYARCTRSVSVGKFLNYLPNFPALISLINFCSTSYV